MKNFDMTNCTLCPRECGADRTKTTGVCGATDKMTVSKTMLHRWEEPCISGRYEKRGSGAIFFSGCSLKCVFCQNKEISRGCEGTYFSPADLADEMKRLEENGAYNINFVSPTHYYPQIIAALDIYRPSIPTVFNTGGYEKAGTVEALRGYADIFLTDFKYGTNSASKYLSEVSDYVENAKKALEVMTDITGEPEFDSDGMMTKGTVVRHLIIPSMRHDSIEALRIIKDTVGTKKILLSLMSQYTPEFAPPEMKKIRRRITTFEYESVRDEALALGFSGFSQDISSANAKYTPDFTKR